MHFSKTGNDFGLVANSNLILRRKQKAICQENLPVYQMPLRPFSLGGSHIKTTGVPIAPVRAVRKGVLPQKVHSGSLLN